jgi:hypothetical protein
MKREYWKECSGCCWMKRAGELYWMCLVRGCPFHPFYTHNNIKLASLGSPIVETYFG